MRIKTDAGDIVDLRKQNLANAIVGGDLQHLAFNRNQASFANAMQRMTYSKQDLIISIGNSVKIHDHSVEQQHSFWGRIMALFTPPTDPEWLKIDGTRLMQLLQFADTETSVKLSASGLYYAEIKTIRLMLSKLLTE